MKNIDFIMPIALILAIILIIVIVKVMEGIESVGGLGIVIPVAIIGVWIHAVKTRND